MSPPRWDESRVRTTPALSGESAREAAGRQRCQDASPQQPDELLWREADVNGKRLFELIVTPLVAVGLLVGCGGGGGSADKTRFCQDNSTLDKAIAPIGPPDDAAKSAQLLQVFKDNQAKIDDFGKTAPSDIKADAQLIVTTINAAVKANSLDGLSVLGGVGQRVDAYCGQNSDGTPIGSTST
jgi:hypothetical protein